MDSCLFLNIGIISYDDFIESIIEVMNKVANTLIKRLIGVIKEIENNYI